MTVVLERGAPARAASSLSLPRSAARRVTVRLAALTAVPLLLGWQRLHTSYWMDEALTVGIAGHRLTGIPGLLVRDGSPPLYYLLLGLWTRAFGTSEVATHSLSLLFAVAVVPTAYWAGRRLFDARTAWFTAAFAAFVPFVHYFAGETRMYALVVLESLVACVAFSDAFIARTRRGVAFFAVSLTVMLYTHYWAIHAALGLAVAAAVLVVVAPNRHALARRVAIGFGAPVLAFLPILPLFLAQLHTTGAPWSHSPALRTVISDIAAIVRDERVLAVLALAVGVGVLSLYGRERPIREMLRDGPSATIAALVAIGVTPIAIGWIAAQVEPSWATRYLAVIVGPLVLICGAGLARARGFGLAALVLMAVIVVQPFTRLSGIDIHDDSKSNAADIAAQVRGALPARSLVLVAQPEAVPLFSGYLGSEFRYADPRGIVDDPSMMDWRDSLAELAAARVPGALTPELQALHHGDRLLLVTAAGQGADTDTEWVQRFRELGLAWWSYLVQQPCVQVVTVAAAPLPEEEHIDFPFDAAVLECG